MTQRVALVTAGGRGIGREAALLLAAAGARLMVVSQSAAGLATLGLEYVATDLGTPEACASAVAETGPLYANRGPTQNITVGQVWSERAAINPQNRVLEPREVAEVITFLCSDAAAA